MAQILENRTDRLFGAAPAVAFLLERARGSGLTAIVSRPQMGKSWLLNEVARQLSEAPDDPYLVGFAEASGNTPDLLLRAVSDLYQRWLDNANYREQFQQSWQQQKDKLLPGVATLIGKLAGELPGIGKLVGGVVEQALGGLVATDADLKKGGLSLSPLQYEQARDLVKAVAQISQRKVALCLDAWEHSADPVAAAQPLKAFAVNADSLPHCHIFLTTRPDPEAIDPLKGVVAAVSGSAVIFEMPTFAPDVGEQRRMVAFLNQEVAATRLVDATDLVGMIDGCPGVLGRWTSKSQRQAMQTQTDLLRIAGDAQAYRFSELEGELEKLQGSQRQLALRLALLPVSASRDGWDALRQTVLGGNDSHGLDEALLDDLLGLNILEGADPPTFGHAKRLEAAVTWFAKCRPTELRLQSGALARRLALRIDGVKQASPQVIMAATSLRDLAPFASIGGADPWPAALCAAATTLFGKPVPTAALAVKDWILQPESDIAGNRLLALGLVNAVFFATSSGDRDGGGKLLATLAVLAERLPADDLIQAQYSKGLGHWHDLAELRTVAQQYPGDARVRNALAWKLFDAMDVARERSNLRAMDEALGELRKLSAGAPLDATTGQNFCRAAYNALRQADEAGNAVKSVSLLGELAAMAKTFSTDTVVAECYARGLYQLLVVSTRAPLEADRTERFLRLRSLSDAFPTNAAIQSICAAAFRHHSAGGAHTSPPNPATARSNGESG
jgi:hypothetical protein